ncbi:hypothetical protein E2562_021018 [Oryza meyeriana var. granulata]|uniref:Phytocyanin domain-containing protein n=1 Tax=Oryza meyeriana var. granulata TaxID=110450 RepID=A0A6G1FAS8_9ORYZ|nr:hypothetical protein E2562_021018 [Oryza meyeriana var. granulata]
MAVASASSRVRRLLLLVAVLAAAAAAAGKRYRVGGPDGWVVPPPDDKELYYVRWASSMTFYIGDSIEFEYKNDSVIMVTKAGYYHCNETAGIDAGDVPVPGDGVRVFNLYNPGKTYFASADLDHCNKGQRLMINVLTAEPPAPAPSSVPPLSPSPAPSGDDATGGGSAAFAPGLAVAVMAMAALVV